MSVSHIGSATCGSEKENLLAKNKLGRRPPKNAPALEFKSFWTGAIPSHPSTADYLEDSGWQMLGNSQFGDCVAVAMANNRRNVTDKLTGTVVYPDWTWVEALYKTQNPNFPTDDNGMDIQTCLEYLNQTGTPDGVKSVAFAKVDYANLEEVKAALAIFGDLILGITVQQANFTDFDNGQPWDYHPDSTNAGGHGVDAGGYTAQAASDVKFITWATKTSFTDAFWANEVEEAWVVVWPEYLGSEEFLASIDVNALAADYKAITGSDLPIPTPVPTPPPTPTPDTADEALAVVAKPWISKWHPFGSNKKMAAALKTWLAAKGL